MKLRINDVEFSYNGTNVLDGVTLTVEPGEMLGLIGPNGAGKSTLLQCINRIIEPDDGTVIIDGSDIANLSQKEIATKVGYIPQDGQSTFPTSVFDAVLLGRKPHASWRPTADDKAQVSSVLSTLGLEEYSLRSIDELSGGQLQKVLIARALVQEAAVLLLDEPTSNLDIRHQLEVLDVVQDQTDDETAAVLAIHDLNLAARYCDKLAMLCDNRIVEVGPPSILTSDSIKRVYGVDATVLSHNVDRFVIPERPDSLTT